MIYKNVGGKIASCCTATCPKWLTLPSVAETYTFLMNFWNTLPESYQQRMYNRTLATVKRQIQQVENPMPAVVISMEAMRVDNAILLDYLTSEVALEEPEI
jgi:murein L,D-transpeptidase YafK